VSLTSDVEFNKQLVRSYIQVVFNEGQTGRAAEFLAPDATWHGSTGTTLEGRDEVVALIRAVVGAMDGLTVTEQNMVAEGDTVAVRHSIEGTHTGELFGVPATGRRIRWEPMSVFRITDGMIANALTLDNLDKVLRDIGGPPR
jgi:steroid delta-isomerase-like uncharacterized protein